MKSIIEVFEEVNDKSNEVTAISEDIKEAIVSIDAVGTQKNIVSKIVKKQGHYCLNLKENSYKIQLIFFMYTCKI